MLGQKCFTGAFATKCTVKSPFKVLLRRDSRLKSAFKVLLRRDARLKSPFNVHLSRDARSIVLLKCFQCFSDEMLGQKWFLVHLRRNVGSKVVFSASQTKCWVKSGF